MPAKKPKAKASVRMVVAYWVKRVWLTMTFDWSPYSRWEFGRMAGAGKPQYWHRRLCRDRDYLAGHTYGREEADPRLARLRSAQGGPAPERVPYQSPGQLLVQLIARGRE